MLLISFSINFLVFKNLKFNKEDNNNHNRYTFEIISQTEDTFIICTTNCLRENIWKE